MAAATLTSKGQVTLPKSVRERLGVEAGDRIEFIESEEGFLILPATRDIRTLKGIVPKPSSPVSIEDMNRTLSKMGRA
jgi:antitoxin PrlF